MTSRAVSPTGPIRSLAPVPPVNLSGASVALGPLQRDLIPLYQTWFNDFEMLRLVDRRFRPLTADQVTAWFESRSRDHADVMVFTIWEQESWKPIGNAALQDIDQRNRVAELGLFIADPRERGNGHGSEVIRLLLTFGFQVLGLQNIMLRVYEYNERALAMYERLGFQEFGRRRGSQFMDGRYWDVIFMECIASEYQGWQPRAS